LVSDDDLVFQPLLDAGDFAARVFERAAVFGRFLFGLFESAGESLAGEAELLKRLGDAFSRFSRGRLGVFDPRGQTQHRAVDGRDGAVESGDGELRAPFDRLDALGQTGRIGWPGRRADVPVVFAFV